MKAQAFRDWMGAMGFKSAAQITRCLDVNRNTAQKWVAAADAGKDPDIKRTVALAMTAAKAELRPWGE